MKRDYDKLMDSRMDSTESQFKQLHQLLQKINVALTFAFQVNFHLNVFE